MGKVKIIHTSLVSGCLYHITKVLSVKCHPCLYYNNVNTSVLMSLSHGLQARKQQQKQQAQAADDGWRRRWAELGLGLKKIRFQSYPVNPKNYNNRRSVLLHLQFMETDALHQLSFMYWAYATRKILSCHSFSGSYLRRILVFLPSRFYFPNE